MSIMIVLRLGAGAPVVHRRSFVVMPPLIGGGGLKGRRGWLVVGAGLRNLSVSFADNSSTALRFGNRPSLPSGQSMTGQKGPIKRAVF